MRIAIAGDTGLLGRALLRRWGVAHEILGVSTGSAPTGIYLKTKPKHFTCDLLRQKQVFQKRLIKFCPEVLVNCIGLVDVGKCQTHPAAAQRLNARLAGDLAQFARSGKIRFVHISTDQVFDGKAMRPYREKDAPHPLNVYGMTKLDGERRVLEADPGALVIRTNIVGFRGDESRPTFAEWLSGALWNKQAITLAEDFVTSSVHVDYFGDFVWRAIRAKINGLVHLASRDAVSKYEFGKKLAKVMGADFSNVKKGRLEQMHLKPERPPFLALDCSVVERRLNCRLPSSRQTIDRLAADFASIHGADHAKK
ncbi:MAG: SDR family oxidoreductase [Candidatus Omnitrophota bacterium]